MLIIECFGKNVYIDDELVGYIAPSGDMYAAGRKFGSLSSEGDIYIQGEYVGYVDETYEIIIGGKPGGYVSDDKNIHFDSVALLNSNENSEDY